ncbi:threonine dehydrogenase-like Zn-dependent dehydrogenase [Arthrobacter sp. UYNi723]
MNAVVVHSAGNLRLEDRPDPDCPAGSVIVDAVTVHPAVYCGESTDCLAGRTNLARRSPTTAALRLPQGRPGAASVARRTRLP